MVSGCQLREHGQGEYFAAGLFGIVERHNLIDDFVAPPIPEEPDYVPSLPAEPPAQRGQATRRDVADGWPFIGPFGRLITEWPLPDRKTHKTETSD